MSKNLETPLQYLKGVGPKRAKTLNKLGLKTIEDLLYYFARHYEDRRNFLPISQLQVNQTTTIKAKVLACTQRKSWQRRNFNIVEAVVGDETGKIWCIWFNQPYVAKYLKVNQTVILYGKVEKYKNRLQITSSEFEVYEDTKEDESGYGLSFARIVPVYPITESLTQRYLRTIIKNCLDQYLPCLKDCLPFYIRQKHNLLNLAKSLLNIHFPETLQLQKEAYRRLSFEEFFLFQIPLLLRKLNRKEKRGFVHKTEGKLLDKFLAGLAFKLTEAQKRTLKEIKSDMARPVPMQRLLQGDVGCGKTVVSFCASMIAIQGGFQVAFMVPTEILARQHYSNLKAALSSFNPQEKPEINLLLGNLKSRAKSQLYRKIKEGETDLVIGTHALLQEDLKFKNLGLVIIDEQHKFGVSQRALLPKKGKNPDCLIMTATPIPRTLAITLYGDLDISVINQIPFQREIKTRWISKEKRNEAYEFIRQKIKEGRQAYIIYPIIEESKTLELKAAKTMYEEFKTKIFSDLRLSLIHGRVASRLQEKIMQDFKNGEVDILIATTVLEVGIDVANAQVMVIEHAERFGLSQLHQLRGRIGRRAGDKADCILISDTNIAQARQRLQVMVKHSNGFCIAEEDLKIRGPGQFFGERQHGLSELRIANPLTQFQLLRQARDEVRRLLRADPKLELRHSLVLQKKLKQRFPDYERLTLVG